MFPVSQTFQIKKVKPVNVLWLTAGDFGPESLDSILGDGSVVSLRVYSTFSLLIRSTMCVSSSCYVSALIPKVAFSRDILDAQFPDTYSTI